MRSNMKQFAATLMLILCAAPLVFSQNNKPAPQRNLFDNKTIGEIRLTLPAKNWGDALDSMRLYGDGMMLAQCAVDGSKYDSIGVRYRGNNSYQMGIRRNPFHLKLNFARPSASHQGQTSLKLSSALRDPSLVREALFSEIAGKYLPTPQTSYVRFFVNDEYVGVFIVVESVDKNFTRKHFGGDGNPFFKAGVDYSSGDFGQCLQKIYGSLEHERDLGCYAGNYEMESDAGWEDLQELTRRLKDNAKNIEQILDVDRALWMLALNNVMVNLSSYSGDKSVNYYLYKDNNGQFQPVFWDLNLAFGSYKNIGSGSDLDLRALQRLEPLLHADNPLKPLASQLLKDPVRRKIYLAHIRQILKDNFENGWYETRAQELQRLIAPAFNEDKFKQYSLEDFQRSLRETIGRRSRVPGIVELMAARAKFLKNHPDLTALPSEISDVAVKSRAKFENQKINAFAITAKADRFPKRMQLHYRFSPDKPYQIVPMMEEASETPLPSGVKMFGANIEARSADDTLDYFIMAENAGTVSFGPTNYTLKPNKVKLSEINK